MASLISVVVDIIIFMIMPVAMPMALMALMSRGSAIETTNTRLMIVSGTMR
ncbi:hypothetical protein MBAV_000921 [Candidatus Magnetobacterium bavaricum]|uniref:Uncharacterized protein n=1 Tax=Candidatus Magnetobacterium bavaricum TaxID=29290 RepID=A0A0F3GYH1_9BACT|nr:hypothetical protein MBAV_000921 [Candidatus Magnetobacterium bavaricum]